MASFPYRGIMIDTSRHYLSIYTIKEILDGILFAKLNILDWHLTDDEFFSLNFGDDPDLKLPEDFIEYTYNKAEIKNLIEYAYIRGITIYPETDNPAHTRFISDLITNKDDDGIITKD